MRLPWEVVPALLAAARVSDPMQPVKALNVPTGRDTVSSVGTNALVTQCTAVASAEGSPLPSDWNNNGAACGMDESSIWAGTEMTNALEVLGDDVDLADDDIDEAIETAPAVNSPTEDGFTSMPEYFINVPVKVSPALRKRCGDANFCVMLQPEYMAQDIKVNIIDILGGPKYPLMHAFVVPADPWVTGNYITPNIYYLLMDSGKQFTSPKSTCLLTLGNLRKVDPQSLLRHVTTHCKPVTSGGPTVYRFDTITPLPTSIRLLPTAGTDTPKHTCAYENLPTTYTARPTVGDAPLSVTPYSRRSKWKRTPRGIIARKTPDLSSAWIFRRGFQDKDVETIGASKCPGTATPTKKN